MKRMHTLTTTLLVFAILAAPAVGQAKERRAQKAKPAVAQGGSGETAQERDRRLQRECRGRPNAGACLGYAY